MTVVLASGEARMHRARLDAGIANFISSMQRSLDALQEETAGWLIRRPAISEVDDHFGMIFAESKSPSNAPLVLPDGIETCVGVIEGKVRIIGVGDVGRDRFVVVKPGESQAVRAVEHPSKIAIFFFQNDSLALSSAATEQAAA